MKDGKILMVDSERNDYLYSVGGRVKFGETTEEAIIREVWEETGVRTELIHPKNTVQYFITDER